MSTPKVSIIIPVYNKGKYLSRTLESIINQVFHDYEVVLIDDGSVDNSREIISAFIKRDKRFRAKFIKNGGVSNARNIGLQHAKGEWIQFLDGDDLIDPLFLFDIFKMKTDEFDVIFSDFVMVDENGKKIKTVSSCVTGLVSGTQICDYYISLQDKNGFFGYISNKLFKRNLLSSISLWFDTKIVLAEDLDFYSRLYQKVEKAFFVDSTSFKYLQNDDNFAFNTNIDYGLQLLVRLNIKKWFISSGKYSEYKKEIDLKISQFVFLVFFHDNENNVSFENDFIEITNSSLIMESLNTYGLKKFEKKVVKPIIEKNYLKLQRAFKIRNFVRMIYRRINKSGKRI